MFSCQPGRQTACINLSHAKDPFKAAIICSSCLILWGQWEGLEWGSFHPRQAVEQTLELSWQISVGKHFQLKYLNLLIRRFPTL